MCLALWLPMGRACLAAECQEFAVIVDPREEEGFTLIEILVVLVILAVLAAIVVLAIGGTRGDATNAACLADVRSIQSAEEAYHLHNNGYSTSEATLTAAGT